MLTPVDRVEIQLVVDNIIDGFLTDGPEVRRTRWTSTAPWGARPNLIAEHGFCALVRVWRGDQAATILFDAGVTTFAALQSMQFLGIDPLAIDTVALSHGHVDHTQGLPAILAQHGGVPVDVHLHPDALLDRRLVMPDGTVFLTPPPDRAALESLGARIVENRGPVLLAGGTVLLTGEIPRVTPFERGLPVHQALTGETRIHGYLGGLHLTGALFEPIIPETIAALKQFAPRRLMPCHCTGWKATHQIAEAMPEPFVIASVGTALVVEAEASPS